ncbi:MAG: hypothetical protein OEL83_17775 [Desulforhopalus sp.]|nr:hypothetical protein [Desulforhopalus sp.]
MKASVLVFCLGLLLGGCSSVTSQFPVGLDDYQVTAKDWAGTWLCGDALITIKVKDEAKGILQLAWIEEKSGNLQFESIICQVSKGRKWLFANVLEESGKKADGTYFWGKIAKEDRKIVIWRPSVAAFREAVAAKRLQAMASTTDPNKTDTYRDDSVHLLDKPETIIDLVESGGSTYFEWEEPMILIKFGN